MIDAYLLFRIACGLLVLGFLYGFAADLRFSISVRRGESYGKWLSVPQMLLGALGTGGMMAGGLLLVFVAATLMSLLVAFAAGWKP